MTAYRNDAALMIILWTYSGQALMLMVVDLLFESRTLFGGLDVPNWPDYLSSVLGDLGRRTKGHSYVL